MNWREMTLIAVIGVIVMMIFRANGLIDSFGTGIVIIGASVAVAILQKMTPGRLNTLTKIFLVWLGLFVGGAYLWEGFSEKAPLTSESLEKQKTITDVRVSEEINPIGTVGIMSVKRDADIVEREEDLRITKEMSKLRQNFLARKITGAQYDERFDKLSKELDENRKRRETRRQWLEERIKKPDKPWYEKTKEWLEDIFDTPDRMIWWVVGLILITFSIVVAVIKRHLSWLPWLPVLFLVLMVLGDRAIWGNLLGENLTKEVSAQPATPTRVRETNVSVWPNRDSEKIIVSRWQNFDWWIPGNKATFIFANGDSIVVTKDEVKKPGNVRIRVKPGEKPKIGILPMDNFRLRSDVTGEARITIL